MAAELTAAAPPARKAARRQTREILAGALAVATLALVVVWASGRGEAGERRGHYTLEARFEQVDGLAVGSPVLLAGLKVGTVAAMRLDPATLKPSVILAIRRGVEFPADSAALILSDGVLGGKFVRIDPGSEDKKMAPGQRFGYQQDAIIVERLLEKIVRAAEARRGAK